MNKIFKVIWSKSKQCYVVVSEVAKNTTGKKKIVVASILAGLAMSTMGTHVMAVSTIPFTDKPSSALANGSVKPATTNGVAIGNAAYSDSNQSIAIGFRSLASGTFLGGSIKPSVAVGAGAHAEGNNTVAIGTVAENRASYGVALGNESKVTSGSDYGIAIGYQTQVSNVHGMAIGEKASASGLIGMALGANAKATGAYSYAGGFNSESGGEAAIAVGKSASASGESAVAVGNGTVATAGDAVAIGTSSQATGGDAIALGKSANASNGDSIAIGQDTVSNNINSVALGKTSKATGASATALGPQAKATGSTAVAIGLNSEANQSATVAVGYNSAASGENAAAYGNTAKAVGKNSLALGANTQATVEGGVALGAGSIANIVAGAGYNPNTGRTNTFTGLSGNALTSTWAAVSIGDGTNTRQLTGLAAGTNNTDAVNVAQLKSMNLAFTADGSTKGDVNLTNSALNVVGDSTYITTKGNNQTLTISGKKQTITVTNGTASASAGMADANNVAQAINQANADQTISYKANGGTANTAKVSDGLNFTNGTSTVSTVGSNGQVSFDLNTTTKQSITDSSTAVNRTIALGGTTGSTTAKKLASGDVKFNIKGQTGTNALITTSASGDDVTIAPTNKLTDAVTAAENAANKDLSNLSTAGNTKIQNLAKTAAAWNVSTNGSGTTAVSGGDTVNFVNGDNIAVTNTGRTITIGTAKNVSFDKITVGGISIDKTAGINAGNKEIKGLAAGTTATSAVNKQQMEDAVKAATDATTALGNNTIALGGDAGSTTAKKLSTNAITFNIKGDTGTNALITTAATGDNVSITPTAKLTNAVAAAENAADKNLSNISTSGKTVIKDLAKGAAQDAVKVAGTGLATVSDNTAGGVKTYTVDVNTGNLVVAANGQVGAAGTTGASGVAGSNGVATTQNVATAINDAVTKAKASTTQALADAEHKFAGDTGTTSVRKHGEVLSIKGGVTNTASLTTGNIGVVSDGAGTLNVQLAKVLSGLTSATFTAAGGNTTVINSDGVTITPSAAGASAISMTTAGINAGNKEIKGVATGTTADAAVNKAQMDAAITAAAGGSLSTEKVVAKTLSGDTNLATVTGQTGTAKGETYEVAVSENAVKNVAKAAAQDAVTVTGTGLATLSDNTAGGVKTYTVNVEEGKLVLDDTTGKIGANGATQGTTAGKNGVATTQNVATAINDAVTKANANNAQALADAKHNFAGDDATVISRKHGEQLNIKGGASTTATDLTSGNIAVVGDTTSGTLNIKMAKALTGLTSATYTDGSGNTQTVTGGSSTISDAAGNSTVVSKGGVTTTDAAGNITTTAPTGVTVTPAGTGTTPISVTTSGISAGNKEIKNVANGTTDDAAVNKKQMDDAVKAATDATTALGNNTIALGSDAGSTTAKKLSTNAITFNIKGDTGANALITTSATGDNVTIAPTAKLTAAVTAAEKSADKDLSNISSAGKTVIKDLAATSAQDAVNVTGTGLATVSDNTTGGVKTYTVNVDEGKLVLDDTTGQIGANGATQGTTAGKNGVATTQNVATAINDAVTKAKASTTQALADAEHKFDGDTGTTSVRKHGEVLSIKGGVITPADLATGNIGVVSDGAGTLNIRLAKALSGLTSASFTTTGGNTTVINGDGVTITPSGTGTSAISMTTAGINAGGTEIKNIADGTAATSAVSKGQMETAIANAQTAATSTEKVVAKTLSGDTNLATVTGQTGTAKGETYEVAVSENAVKNVAKAAAQDAVTVTGTGLATVSDNTTGGVKTYTVNVDEGKLVLDDTTGKIGANGATQGTIVGKNGVATTQNVATAINDAVTKANANNAQALADAKHNFAGDDATVISRKHGEQLNIKGGASTTATDLTSGNIAVVGDTTSGTLNIKIAKALTGLTSATFTDRSGNTQTVTGGSSTITDGAGNTTAMTKGGLSTTDGTHATTVAPTGVTATDGTNTVKLNGSGIDAGNTQIKNVAKATTDDAAVNKKQMDDAVKAATDATTALGNNTIALGSDAGSTTAKKLSTNAITFNIKGDTGANALITTSATGDDVTIAPTAKLIAAVTAAEKSADKDLSNITSAGETVIKNLAVTSAQDAVKVTGTGLATVSDNTTGGVKTYTVNVEEGKLVLDDTTGQIGANGATQGTTAGKNGVATTQNVATAINDAVTKAKASTTQALADAEHKFDGDTGTTSVRKHGEVLSIKGGVTTPADLATGNIGVVSDGAGTLNIRLAKVLSGLTSATFTDGSGNTQTVTGGSSTITDGAGHTTAMTKAGLSTTDGTNTTTVAPTGVTATDGTNTVKLNGSGIDAGNTQIKNVSKATTDDAAVNKKQMDDAVKAATDATTALGNNTIALGSDAGSTTAKKLSTNAITFNIKGDTGANALITTSATGDDVTVAPTAKLTAAVTAAEKSADKDLSNISSAGKTVIKDLAVTSAQDAVNVTGTGLATVSNNTAGGVKIYTVDVKAGNLVVDGNGQAGAAGATGAGGAVGTDGVATTQNVATAINDAITKSNANTAQALADAEHKFDGDTGTTSVRKHGEVLSIKGGVTNPADLVAGNIGVVSDGAGTLNIRLAKVLSGLTSATFTDASGNTQTLTGASSIISDGAGNTTTMTKGGLSTTDGTNTTTVAPTGVTATDGTNTVKLNGSGIDAGNTQIKNVGKATTDDAAVNKKQMDDAVKAASDATTALGNNTITLGGNTGSTNAQKLNTFGGIQFNINGESGANALITTTASGNTVSIASTAKLSNAVAAAENAANKDLSNLSANGESRIKDLAKSAASWNVQTNGGATTAVSGGDNVNFVDGKNITITNTGREITVATKDDVTFNKVIVGGMTLDNNGMDAGNKEIKNVAAGTTANSAVNKQQLDNAISGVSNINYTTSSTTDRAGSTPVRSVALSTGFDFKGDGNIQVTQDAVNNGVIHYALNSNLSGITSITGAGNGAPMMTFNSQNGNTPANVSINSNLDMGGHRITGVGPAEKPTDAVNKQQVDQALRGLTGMADNAARQYASKAGANAAALAALKPIQYDPLEPTQIMAGVGNYKSQTAVALGMAHYTNENTMFNIGISLDSHDNMVNAGITHKFGYSPEKKAIPDRYKGGPISSIYVMQDEMQALLAKDQEKDAIISKQADEIDVLRKQNDDMQRKIDMILAKLQ
ncbi:YadA-like family protein [Veillonella tobetsuensis]|uniref:YadA-like family protein n=1 Tax=Veillonella tobetsuensis TaxID=1110546 RepID=UPI0007512FBD|nr:YadA-like family protein [Veillonella tobetsuensis]